jgi:hypothetical protein
VSYKVLSGAAGDPAWLPPHIIEWLWTHRRGLLKWMKRNKYDWGKWRRRR